MERPSILVVADDLLVRLNTADILRNAGFEVFEAKGAATALALLQRRQGIRLLCTEVRLSGELDGVDLVLSTRDRHPETRAILVSPHDRDRSRLPSVPFLSNPFHERRLVEVAREELSALDF